MPAADMARNKRICHHSAAVPTRDLSVSIVASADLCRSHSNDQNVSCCRERSECERRLKADRLVAAPPASGEQPAWFRGKEPHEPRFAPEKTNPCLVISSTQTIAEEERRQTKKEALPVTPTPGPDTVKLDAAQTTREARQIKKVRIYGHSMGLSRVSDVRVGEIRFWGGRLQMRLVRDAPAESTLAA